jgi:hypothetical protein
MKDFKVDIREVIWELGNEILLVKSYRDRFNDTAESEEYRFTEDEIHIENNRYESEIDMLNKIRNDYMRMHDLTEDDIKKYLDEEDESYLIMEEINPVSMTSEVESITYTIK